MPTFHTGATTGSWLIFDDRVVACAGTGGGPLYMGGVGGYLYTGSTSASIVTDGATGWYYPVQAPPPAAPAEFPPSRVSTRDRLARARDRATELLLSFLDEEQRRDYERDRSFFVQGSLGNRYRIRPGMNGNVDWMPGDEPLGVLCAHPSMREQWLPDSDVALSQMLALMTNEDQWLSHANVHRGQRPAIEAVG